MSLEHCWWRLRVATHVFVRTLTKESSLCLLARAVMCWVHVEPKGTGSCDQLTQSCCTGLTWTSRPYCKNKASSVTIYAENGGFNYTFIMIDVCVAIQIIQVSFSVILFKFGRKKSCVPALKWNSWILYGCFSLARDLWGVISSSCCFRTFFSPDSGCRVSVLLSDSLVISPPNRPPPPQSCWCGVFSKVPGYSGIIRSQTDVESSF